MLTQIKRHLNKLPFLNSIIKKIHFVLFYKRNFQSSQYWKLRYQKWWNSGFWSYGQLAQFKAKIINGFIINNNIRSVIEFGCGDGNNLKYFQIPKYIGLDISENAISLCRNLFVHDITKSFFLYNPNAFFDRHSIFRAQCSISLDVIYHLVEDEVFEKYMFDLFSASYEFVIIYSSNDESMNFGPAQHIKHRNFTGWILKNMPQWLLQEEIKNTYPLRYNQSEESFSDFYVFKFFPDKN